MTTQRPDRMTREGMFWNAARILDRFDQVVATTTTPLSDDDEKAGSTDGAESGDSEDPFEEMVRKLPVPLIEYTEGAILLSIVLPPDASYVGRVGTGLAYRYRASGTPGNESTWSDARPVSLTALVSPIPDRSKKVVLDMIIFVCHPTGNKVFTEGLWWKEIISHSTGLLVIEPSSSSVPPKASSELSSDEDDAGLVDTESDCSGQSPPGSDMSFRAAINLANATDTAEQEYPVTRYLAPDGKDRASMLYYYAWHNDELLKGNAICLERIILMEMTPLASQSVITGEENNVLQRLDNLLKRTTTPAADHGEEQADSRDQEIKEESNHDIAPDLPGQNNLQENITEWTIADNSDPVDKQTSEQSVIKGADKAPLNNLGEEDSGNILQDEEEMTKRHEATRLDNMIGTREEEESSLPADSPHPVATTDAETNADCTAPAASSQSNNDIFDETYGLSPIKEHTASK